MVDGDASPADEESARVWMAKPSAEHAVQLGAKGTSARGSLRRYDLIRVEVGVTAAKLAQVGLQLVDRWRRMRKLEYVDRQAHARGATLAWPAWLLATGERNVHDAKREIALDYPCVLIHVIAIDVRIQAYWWRRVAVAAKQRRRFGDDSDHTAPRPRARSHRGDERRHQVWRSGARAGRSRNSRRTR